MTLNYAIYQYKGDLQIPNCQIQMKAISLQRSELVTTSNRQAAAVQAAAILLITADGMAPGTKKHNQDWRTYRCLLNSTYWYFTI